MTNLSGKTIYPALLDIDSDYGMPEVARAGGRGGRGGVPQYESSKKGAYYWNQAIQPENEASVLFKADAKKADELRKLGFGAVLTHPHDGIARGTGTLVTWPTTWKIRWCSNRRPRPTTHSARERRGSSTPTP